MNLEHLVNQLSAERYYVLRRSVELGKWPDGRKLSQDEQEAALQALILYDQRHKAPEDQIGYIENPKKGSVCDAPHEEHHHADRLIVKTQSSS